MFVTVLIGGDVCPIGRNETLFTQGDSKAILGDLLPEFDEADLSMVNLECPLIRSSTPSRKCGPNIGVPDACAQGFQAMGVDVVGLANNHIMDHGAAGLESTIDALQRSGIRHVGAGRNLREASEISIHNIRGLRVGVLAMADHEFGIASLCVPGANPVSSIDFVRQMRLHRAGVDYLVVLLHAGKEYYSYPSPALQNRCRFFVEEGANAVLCQHSHCPGCYERYRGGQIVYGQGNFLFDGYPKKRGNWNRGFLVKLSIQSGGTADMELLPYLQSDEHAGARRMQDHVAKPFLASIETRSAQAADDHFVSENWQKFCRSKRSYYFSVLRGHAVPLELLNQVTKYTNWLYSKHALLRLLNVVRCEAHREALLSILEEEQR